MSNDLTKRLTKIWGELDPVDEWREAIADAIDALTAQAREIERLRSAALGHETNCMTKAREIEALRAEANAALNLWPRDCRLCANYTTSSGGCTSAVQCVDSDQFKTTTPRQYWTAVTP